MLGRCAEKISLDFLVSVLGVGIVTLTGCDVVYDAGLKLSYALAMPSRRVYSDGTLDGVALPVLVFGEC